MKTKTKTIEKQIRKTIHEGQTSTGNHRQCPVAYELYTQEKMGIHLDEGCTVTFHDPLSGEPVTYNLTRHDDIYFHSKEWSELKNYFNHPWMHIPGRLAW